MKRILFLITKSEVGGAQKWTKEQLDICQGRFLCHLATNREGWLTVSSNYESIFLNRLIEKRFSLKYLYLLSKYVRANKIEIVVCSSANAGIYGRLLKFTNPKLRVTYVSHGWSAIYAEKRLAWFYTFVEKILSSVGDSVLCVSKHDFDTAVEVIRVRRQKLKHLSNSIIPLSEQTSLEGRDRNRILCVARASPPKRTDLLIEAVRDVDVELHVIGSGECISDLKAQAPSNVIFYGEVQGFRKFGEFDIFCLISDSEGLPLAGLEAMSCGLPLILSDVGGCSELIEGNGSLVSNNYQSIRAAILENIGDRRLRSKASLDLYHRKFNLINNQMEFINYYNDL